MNARLTLVLNLALDGMEGMLTNAKWAALAKCSGDTALRDITDLLTGEVLGKLEGGGAAPDTGWTNRAVALAWWHRQRDCGGGSARQRRQYAVVAESHGDGNPRGRRSRAGEGVAGGVAGGWGAEASVAWKWFSAAYISRVGDQT